MDLEKSRFFRLLLYLGIFLSLIRVSSSDEHIFAQGMLASVLCYFTEQAICTLQPLQASRTLHWVSQLFVKHLGCRSWIAVHQKYINPGMRIPVIDPPAVLECCNAS